MQHSVSKHKFRTWDAGDSGQDAFAVALMEFNKNALSCKGKVVYLTYHTLIGLNIFIPYPYRTEYAVQYEQTVSFPLEQ